MQEQGKTTEEAFRELISRRGWYTSMLIEGKPVNKKTAFDAKQRFLTGRGISIETMEKYLLAAGYQVVQEKLWIDLT